MEFRHLRAFVIATQERNISLAAKRLFVTQPAVSRMIREMETELGAKLFHREQRGLSLTYDGELFLPYAKQILALYDQALQLTSQRRDAAKTVSMGFISASLDAFIAPMLQHLKARCPGIMVTLHELLPAEQIKRLRKGQIDIALVGTPCGSVLDEFESVVLRELPQQAIVPASHRLAARKRLGLNDLRDELFIGFNEDVFPGRNQLIQRACSTAGFTPRMDMQVDGLIALLGMVGSGAGVSIVPSEVGSLPHPGVVFLPLMGKMDPELFCAVWRRNDPEDKVLSVVAALQTMRHATVQPEEHPRQP